MRAKQIPEDLVRRVSLDESCESGLRWVEGKRKGKPAGCKLKTNAWQLRYKGKGYFAHRIIWLIVTGEDPGELQIDHKDGNPSNNSISNLRLATPAENMQNRSKHKNSKQNYKGVSFSRITGKYRAVVSIKGIPKYFGPYDTEEQAAKAYNQAAAEYYGEFARLNLIVDASDYS